MDNSSYRRDSMPLASEGPCTRVHPLTYIIKNKTNLENVCLRTKFKLEFLQEGVGSSLPVRLCSWQGGKGERERTLDDG